VKVALAARRVTSVLYCLNLVPGSCRVKDALGDTIPPAAHVLRSLFNLVQADAHFPESQHWQLIGMS